MSLIPLSVLVYLCVGVIGGVAGSFVGGYRNWRDHDFEALAFAVMFWPFIPAAIIFWGLVWTLFFAPARLARRLRGDRP